MENLKDNEVVWGEGPSDAKLIIIGQNPGPDEMREGRPFIGGSGRILDRALQQSGIARARTYVTNISKHFVAPGKPLPQATIEQDRWMLERELSTLSKAEVIVTLGKEAFEALTGKDLKLRHNRDAAEKQATAWLRACPWSLSADPFPSIPKYSNLENKWIIPEVHPAYIMRTGFGDTPQFIEGLRKAKRFIDGERPPTEHFIGEPTNEEVRQYLLECVAEGEIGLDIETPETAVDDDELDPLVETPIDLIGISCRLGESIAIRPDQFFLLQQFLSGESHPEKKITCWTHNGGNFDFYHLGKRRFDLTGLLRGDVMLGMHLLWSHLTNKDAATCFSLFTSIPYYKNTRKLASEFYDTIGNCRDTYGALWAGRNIVREMRRFPKMVDCFWQHMMAVTDLINDWRVIGVNTDVKEAERLLLILYKQLQAYETWWSNACPNYAWSSPKQLIELFTGLGLPLQMRNRQRKDGTRYRSPSVDDDVLELYATKYQNQTARLVQTMRALRHAGDFIGIAKPDGRIHPRIKAHGQVGGRLQAVDGNVYQIPEEIGGVCPRTIIIPDRPRDQVVIVADFSQIELRLYAIQAGAKNLLDRMATGDYIYGFFYEDIFKRSFFKAGLPRTKSNILDSVKPWEILVVKSWPLGFIYGRGIPDTSGTQLSSRESAEQYHKFHRDNPEIKRLHVQLEYNATRDGYLLSPFGRMRRFPNPKQAHNEILSFPGQTVAVDVLYRNVLTSGLNEALFEKFSGRLVFTVHDSAICCVLKEKAREAAECIKSYMERPLPELDGWSIPAEVKIGPNWGAVKSLEKYFALEPARAALEVQS